jgi:hypothetical protein
MTSFVWMDCNSPRGAYVLAGGSSADLGFADATVRLVSDSELVTCGTHGTTPSTFACRHLTRGVACGYHASVEDPRAFAESTRSATRARCERSAYPERG